MLLGHVESEKERWAIINSEVTLGNYFVFLVQVLFNILLFGSEMIS